MTEKRAGLSAMTLKYIAMATMLVDHMGYVLFPWILWLRCVGRIAFPIFAFQIAEGCIRTHDRRRYALRLLLFAVLTEVPFDLAFSGLAAGSELPECPVDVCWLGRWCAGRRTGRRGPRTPCTFWRPRRRLPEPSGCWRSAIRTTAAGALALILLFHLSRGNRLIQLAGLAVLPVASVGGVSIELYALVSLAFIWLYDGRRGYCSRPIQWLCYAFYPVHLLLLWLYARTVDSIWYLT